MGTLFIRKTGTTALATSATAIADLTASVTSGQRYWFMYWLPIVTVGGPTNVTVTLTGPAMTEKQWSVEKYAGGATAAAGAWESAATTMPETSGGPAIATCVLVVVRGVILPSASGTLGLSGTRTGGTSSTVRANSYLEIKKLF